MKPPIPRIFADIGRSLISGEEPDGRVLLVWSGMSLTAGDFKLACAAYHGVLLEDLERAVAKEAVKQGGSDAKVS